MQFTYYGTHPTDQSYQIVDRKSDKWKIYRKYEIAQLEDDGCGIVLHEVDEQLPDNLKYAQWGETYPDKDSMYSRYYRCERCSWYVWHPVSYCHCCGGRMHIIKSYSSKDLLDLAKDKGYTHGGF